MAKENKTQKCKRSEAYAAESSLEKPLIFRNKAGCAQAFTL